VDEPTLSYNCRLRPRFEVLSTSEVYLPTVIETNPPIEDYFPTGRDYRHVGYREERDCGSTMLVEIQQVGDAFPYLRTLSIRCGFCTCWTHVCGLCRCVPQHLCVLMYYGEDGNPTPIALHSNLVLEWNPEILGWGDEFDPIRLLLIEDYKGDCVVDIDYGTYEVPTLAGHIYPNYPAYDCGNESWWREMDDEVQFPAVIYNDYENGKNFTVVALSHAAACIPTPCNEATPCAEYCGGFPPKLYLDITMTYTDVDGPAWPPPPPVVIPLETVELSFIDTGGYVVFGMVDFICGYVGFIPSVTIPGVGVCCAVWFFLFGGYLRIRIKAPAEGGCENNEVMQIDVPLIESCDPYSAIQDAADPAGYPCGQYGLQCPCLYLPGGYDLRSCASLIAVSITE